MNRLQSQFYLSFPVVQEDYTMIFIDLRNYSRLLNNARFIKFFKNFSAKMDTGNEPSLYLLALSEFKKEKGHNKIKLSAEDLKLLHLNTDLETRRFVQLPEWEEKKFYLVTEKFFWFWPTFNLGSARNALLLDMQLKGIGRTPIAIRNDHAHSWGGLYLWQAMKGYVISHLYEGVAPLGILSTSYVAVNDNDLTSKQIKTSAIGLYVRESDSLRITQLITRFDPNEKGDPKLILKGVLNQTNSRSTKDHVEKIIFSYSSLFLMGLRHMAVTRENITIDGKLIDYEDLKLDADEKTYRIFVQLNSCQKKMSKGVARFKGVQLYASSCHFYLDAIKLTVIGLRHLDPAFQMSELQIKKAFFKMINELGKTVFIIDRDLMAFIKMLIFQDAIYEKGEQTLKLPKNINGNEILNLIKKRPHKITLEQDLGGGIEANHYLVDFPRVEFRNKLLEDYNVQAMKGSESLMDILFKKLQLESFTGKLDFDKMLNYTSDCNERIAKHTLSFPYQWNRGKVSLVNNSLDEHKKKFKSKIKTELKAKLESFDFYSDDTKNKILRGAVIILPNGVKHYMLLCPAYFAVSNSNSR